MSQPLAVLVSGGLDSAILVGDALHKGHIVHPLYVRQGMAWEGVEQQYLRQFLDALSQSRLRPLHVLELPVTDVYGDHWSVTGQGVPGSETPDEAVFLPGRNVFLLAKALVWCHLRGIPAVALAPLESNPFPDATNRFFDSFSAIVNEAVQGRVQVLRPYAGLHKTEVMKRGQGLPLGLTFSCIRPRDGKHCGQCNKCAERKRAFAEAGLSDPTTYHQETSCSA